MLLSMLIIFWGVAEHARLSGQLDGRGRQSWRGSVRHLSGRWNGWGLGEEETVRCRVRYLSYHWNKGQADGQGKDPFNNTPAQLV